jgi:hypothetical protein
MELLCRPGIISAIRDGGTAMAHVQPGLDDRHRDADGDISKKHGNTRITNLRDTYGKDFAPGVPGTTKLKDALKGLDEPSLSKLIQDER